MRVDSLRFGNVGSIFADVRLYRNMLRGVVLSFVVALVCSCKSTAPVAPMTCDACWKSQCTSALAACSANTDCKAIEDCVTEQSPCTNWKSAAYCDDDCTKVFCANLYPAGIPLYKALGMCDIPAECSPQCAELCTANANIQKCQINDLCDLAHPDPDACKCNTIDGGSEDAHDAALETPDGDGPPDSCPITPACPDPSTVSGALGLSVTDPEGSTTVTGGITVRICLYKRSPGTKNQTTTIRYEYPDSEVDFMNSRIGFMSTMDDGNVGEPPVPAFFSPDYGLNTVVAWLGCVTVEISSFAPAASEEAYIASMIPVLNP